ncbi:hemolysin family protein [Acinetobacter sp. C26M]|uniref:hemolysin family protein n=1 Tax=unclassified Acinetobacter TaxID=196816 RepID=UPI0014238E09|nr:MULTISPECIES: hemolysin family protein [unclassified Acinetobacter]NIE96869.1 HlyC/CorC family transporter [Acinetobacter sp. Tr-809]USA45527.1 hemolysin family protein [Acinetobacter sp. C26M]USA49028.1 hemolysin family protein [Acinetobacter sp. C26G]
MDIFQSMMILVLLVACSFFLSLSEIAIAGSRKLKLKLIAESGEERANKVIELQENSADFFASTQVGVNAVAILGGIVGESSLRPYFQNLATELYPGPWADTIGFSLSFLTVTSLFILFADLMPKRLAMIFPEKLAIKVINPIIIFIKICRPLAWVINIIANSIFRIFKIDTKRDDSMTFDDISAIVNAGAQAGVLQKQEHHFIENVFELEERTVPSSMTARENIVYFTLDEAEKSIRQKLADHPYSKFLVCSEHIDQVIGYVDAKDILVRILHNQSFTQLNESIIRNVLIIPDTLTLSELLDRFRSTKEKFAVVINEYALVVGVITLSDIMITVMGDWVTPMDEEQQIIKRDNHSWLIDGSTPIEDVKHALAIEEFPDNENYETIAGFIMYRLRKIPRPADAVEYAGFKFEVVDIDHYKIDQLLVTQILPTLENDAPAPQND